ncbi:MAG: ubiquinone/menaquinone biosynthesis methyltransferase [Syntrophales bacterium]|nr:ubiquinone/menaquinone biosynthesis methyltransferase [Syntrophales bacterium]
MGGLFDGIAPTYDRLNRILSLGIDRSWRRAAVRELAIEDGDTVLDVATGTGDLAIAALSGASCRIAGIDLSREMIAVASRKSKSRGHSRRALFLIGDALSVPLKSGSIHRAMVAFGIRNMKSPDGFFDELRRVLVQGGRAMILEFALPENPLLRALYLVYFARVLPLIGGLLSGNRDAYRYLTESVLDFPSPAHLLLMMNRHGFGVIMSRRLFPGIVHLFVIEKQPGRFSGLGDIKNEGLSGHSPGCTSPPRLHQPRQADQFSHAPGLGDAS